MGSHLVVLNSSNVAIDLLERRSVMYSDRVREFFDTFKTSSHEYLPLATDAYGKRTVRTTTPLVTALTNGNLPQDGMFLVLPSNAVRKYLAHPPPLISSLFQRFSRGSVRRQNLQGSEHLPPSAFPISRTLFEACAFVRRSPLDSVLPSPQAHRISPNPEASLCH